MKDEKVRLWLAISLSALLVLFPLARLGIIPGFIEEISQHTVENGHGKWIEYFKPTDLLLVLVGLVQIWILGRQAAISDRQTGIAERAMTVSEEPKLFVRYVAFAMEASSGNLHPNAIYRVQLISNMPITIKARHAELVFMFHKDMPTSPDYRTRWDHIHLVVDGGDLRELREYIPSLDNSVAGSGSGEYFLGIIPLTQVCRWGRFGASKGCPDGQQAHRPPVLRQVPH